MSKKTVLVLGATGMLGSMVYRRLLWATDVCVFGTARKAPEHTVGIFNFDFDLWDGSHQLHTIINNIKPEFIINCIGKIPQASPKNDEEYYQQNYYLPSTILNCYPDIKLIQPSTDCVYSGEPIPGRERNLYTIDDIEHYSHEPYGLSKRMFDDINNNKCVILRSSIIGPNLHKSGNGLFDWALSKKRQNINGYKNHFWNGNTTFEFANRILEIIRSENYESGVYTLGNEEIVSKYDLLQMISKCYKLDLTISEFETEKTIDRTLQVSNTLPKISIQLENMKLWLTLQGMKL